MNFANLKYLIYSDLYRIDGRLGRPALLRELALGEEGFRYLFWFRVCSYLRMCRLLKYCLYPLARLVLRRYRYKYGISILDKTQIGSGFYIGHFSCIVVNQAAIIGRNCNISQGVTLGQSNRGASRGCPVIGDNVYIGPGAKIFGAVSIGNNVAIGANCVVTKDVPDNAVVVGVPARVISQDGAAGYVNNVDYDEFLRGERSPAGLAPAADC